MLKVGIIGARGYTGEELIGILIKHPKTKINYLTARLKKPVPVSKIYPRFKNRIDLLCRDFNLDTALDAADLFFLALPHTAAMDIAPKLLKENKKVIDLSADYRITDPEIYEAWYKVTHKDIYNLKRSVYGLAELNAKEIKRASFVANPGCYPTAAILSLAPLLRNKTRGLTDIIIDAKSGYSGAGRKDKDDPFLSKLENNFQAYKVDSHQHAPEINQELSKLAQKEIRVTFVPHLLPIERGILETIYVRTGRQSPVTGHQSPVNSNRLIDLYKKFYKNKPFVRIKTSGEFPQIKDVQFTNFCDIGVKASEDGRTIIIISAIDNLLKGASGQAVQNMNLMCGFEETSGLL